VADYVVIALANNLAVLHNNGAKAPSCKHTATSSDSEREVSPTDVKSANITLRGKLQTISK
jgi:hypothetical protein